MTPLLAPVDPDVKTMVASNSGVRLAICSRYQSKSGSTPSKCTLSAPLSMVRTCRSLESWTKSSSHWMYCSSDDQHFYIGIVQLLEDHIFGQEGWIQSTVTAPRESSAISIQHHSARVLTKWQPSSCDTQSFNRRANPATCSSASCRLIPFQSIFGC